MVTSATVATPEAARWLQRRRQPTLTVKTTGNSGINNDRIGHNSGHVFIVVSALTVFIIFGHYHLRRHHRRYFRCWWKTSISFTGWNSNTVLHHEILIERDMVTDKLRTKFPFKKNSNCNTVVSFTGMVVSFAGNGGEKEKVKRINFF